MKTFSKIVLAVWIALSSGLVFGARPVDAACALSDAWAPDFPDDRIPVWYSMHDTGYKTGIQYTDVGNSGDIGWGSWADERAWIQAAIDLVNTASVGGPKLYLAGLDNHVAPGNYLSMNEGITVHSYSCDGLPSGAIAGSNSGGNKAYVAMVPGGAGRCSPNPAVSTLWWVDPGQNTTPGWGGTFDFVGVLVHEFGHILGLDHTDGSGDCDENVFASAETTNSVMYSWQKDFRRRLRADDIVALRKIWEEPARTAKWWSSTALPPSPDSWTEEGELSPGFTVNTPVILSGAQGADDGLVIAAMTNDADEIHYQRGTVIGGGWADAMPIPLIAGNGARPKSLDRVAVAQGRSLATNEPRYMIAWVGENVPYDDVPDDCCEAEPTDDAGTQVRIHYQVFSDGEWKPVQSTEPTRYKNLSVGYDPKEDLFLLAWIDTCIPSSTLEICQPLLNPKYEQVANQFLWVKTVKAWLGGGGCVQALTTAGHVFETGGISCTLSPRPDDHTKCIIPVTNTDSFGPAMRYIEGHIGEHDSFICFVREVYPPTTLEQVSYGAVGTAQAADVADDLLATFIPNFSVDPQSADYARTCTLDRKAPFGFVDGEPQNVKGFPSELWPLGIGSLTEDGNTEWRVIGY